MDNGNEFKFDKIVVAIACGIALLLFSNNMGNLLYGGIIPIQKPGFLVKAEDNINETTSVAPKLPDVLDIKSIMATADITVGAKVAQKCIVCHTLNKGEPNKVGPNLWGIIGAKVGHSATFSYSSNIMKMHDDNQVWDEEKLYRFLFAPKQYIEGTKMAFAGVKNDQERASVIAYLKNLAK